MRPFYLQQALKKICCRAATINNIQEPKLKINVVNNENDKM